MRVVKRRMTTSNYSWRARQRQTDCWLGDDSFPSPRQPFLSASCPANLLPRSIDLRLSAGRHPTSVVLRVSRRGWSRLVTGGHCMTYWTPRANVIGHRLITRWMQSFRSYSRADTPPRPPTRPRMTDDNELILRAPVTQRRYRPIRSRFLDRIESPSRCCCAAHPASRLELQCHAAELTAGQTETRKYAVVRLPTDRLFVSERIHCG